MRVVGNDIYGEGLDQACLEHWVSCLEVDEQDLEAVEVRSIENFGAEDEGCRERQQTSCKEKLRRW